MGGLLYPLRQQAFDSVEADRRSGVRQKIQTGNSKFSRMDRRVRSQLRRLKIVNIVFGRHGEAFGIGESFSGESPVVVGPKNDERRLSSPGDHDRAGEGGSLNLADVLLKLLNCKSGHGASGKRQGLSFGF